MSYTKSEIDAELVRRQQQPSRADIDAELARRGAFNFDKEFSMNRRNPNETKGFHGIGNDIQNSFKKSAKWLGTPFTDPEAALKGFGELIGHAGEAAKQINYEPVRAYKNSVVGVGKAGHGLASTPGNILDYLAKKELIPKEWEGKLKPAEFPELGETYGIQELGTEKPGDKFIQKVAELLPFIRGGEIGLHGAGTSNVNRLLNLHGPGMARQMAQRSAALAAHSLGQNEDPIQAALAYAGPAAAIRGGFGVANAAKNMKNPFAGADLTPTGFIAKHYGNHLSADELAANLRSAQGTETGLGRVLQSPGMAKTYENVSTHIPFAGGANAFSRTGEKIKERANETIAGLNKNGLVVNPNEAANALLHEAKNTQNKIKNDMFKPVEKLEKKENFQVELPKSTSRARANIKSIEDGPLYKHNDKFKAAARKLFGLTNTSEKVKSEILGPNGLPLISKTNTPSIVETRMVADDLYEAGKKMLNNNNSADQQRGKLYISLAKDIRKELIEEINTKGSPELQKADALAMANFKQNYVPFLDEDIHGLLKGGNLSETFIRDVIRPSKINDEVNDIIKVKALLPEEQKALLGQGYLASAINKEGQLDPRELLKKINSLGSKQFNELFDETGKQALLDFERLVKNNPEAMNAMFNPYNGYRNSTWASGLLSSILSHGDIMTGLASVASQAALAKAFNKMMTSEKFREKVVTKKIKRINTNE